MSNPITPTYSELRLANRLGMLASQVEAGEAPDEDDLLAALREAQFVLLGTRYAHGVTTPVETKLDRFLQMVRLWVERDGGDMDKALSWMYSDGVLGTFNDQQKGGA